MTSIIETKLEASRKELLDIGLRNPLINFTTRKSKIDIIDELSEKIFDLLVTSNKTMRFLPLSEPTNIEDSDIIDLYSEDKNNTSVLGKDTDDLIDGKKDRKYVDNYLQTNLDSTSLQLRLLKINTTASTFIEEQGFNALYLGLGFLHWYESDSADKVRKAPLLLIPVKLERSSAQERFKITYTGEEIGSNISLQEKLKTEFSIELPDLDDEEISVKKYFDIVRKKIARLKKWTVEDNEIILSFFSFGKLRMYKDLDYKIWPKNSNPLESPIIMALLQDGFNDNNVDLNDGSDIDSLIDIREQHLVLDADSSQTIAIELVKRGKNLVIQGPPGTGKSQTITNLIAEAVGQNKNVLFIAEKMAALEVVKRRLDFIGLGDAVLELHSHKANKKLLLDELKRTISLNKPIVHGEDNNIATFELIREKLNNYCKAVNTPILNTSVTPIVAIGKIIDFKKKHDNLFVFDFAFMSGWNNSDFERHKLIIEDLQRCLTSILHPKDNPFWPSKLNLLLPQEESKFIQLLDLCHTTFNDFNLLIKVLFDELGITSNQTMNYSKIVIDLVTDIKNAPNLKQLKINGTFWFNHTDEIFEVLSNGMSLSKIHRYYSDIISKDAWNKELTQIRKDINLYGAKWWRYFISNYRKSISEYKSLFISEFPKSRNAQLEIISNIDMYNSNQLFINSRNELLSNAFNIDKDFKSVDWKNLSLSSKWYIDFINKYRSVNNLDQIITSILINRDKDKIFNISEKSRELLCQVEKAFSNLFNFLKYDSIEWQNEHNFDRINELLVQFNNISALRDLTKFNIVSEELSSSGLSFIVRDFLQRKFDSDKVLPSFIYSWYQGLLFHAFEEREPLRQFDRERHEFNIEKFKSLDKTIFEYNKTVLALRHWESMPDFVLGRGQTATLKREMSKKRRILPIRKLMIETGTAIQSIKPIFMMSPLSIANFLPPKSIEFDIVIFDEASQIKPVDAFGGLIRAKQAVVVGDSKQLPPTNFFESNINDNPDLEDEPTSISADMESILNLFVAQNAHEKMLRWHYRSKHESLIAVSNYEFYDNNLVIFPSPSGSLDTRGLIFNFIKDSFYDRGKTSTNPLEAKYVAAQVMEHAKSMPHLSLGVVAFSTAQRDSIQFHLELMRRNDISCEDFFFGHKDEPFFIKNLENVQGDERDVIFISIGYGKTKEGYLSHNFGPLNKEGGERRLNVIISRAKRTCEVFANFTSDDIDLSRSSQRGVVALKRFLLYAQNRRIDVATSNTLETDSIFEDQVIDSLIKLGYSVESQVGVSQFRIDIAIRDQNKPGRFLIGIECDGAKYHSSLSARDRDRLRQEILENLGWRIHRIWSTEWFREQEKELKKVVESIEKAKIYWSSIDSNSFAKKEIPIATTSFIIREPNDENNSNNILTEYKKCEMELNLFGKELHELTSQELSSSIVEIISIEGPIHKDIVIHRIIELSSLNRTGNRINRTIERALQYVVRKKFVMQSNSFYFTESSIIVPRNRSNLSLNERAYEYISDLEFIEAIKLIIEKSFSIPKEKAISNAYNLLGISRVTKNYLEHGSKIIDQLIKKKGLKINAMNELELIND